MSSEGQAGPAPGLLLVLSAPSGAGKTTLAHRFRETHPDAVFSVSATTRAPRGAERDGVDYHFVSPERFAALVTEGAFAEWAEVHGQRYGTLRATVEDALADGRIAVFDIDVQGGARLKDVWPRQAACVLLLPPSMEELERLIGRVSSLAPQAVDQYRERLSERIAELARGLPVDAGRLARAGGDGLRPAAQPGRAGAPPPGPIHRQ